MAAIVVEPREGEASLADAAAIAERIGAPEEEVRQVLNDPERVRTVMRERHLTVEAAAFVLVANAQARRRKDATLTVRHGE